MYPYHRMDVASEIYDLLFRLGVTANYAGFFQTASAVHLCTEQPDRLRLVTKWVYPDVAKRYNTNWKAVERNIRRVNGIAWEQNRSLLWQLAGRELLYKPSNAQFLAILSHVLQSRRTDPPEVHERCEADALPGEGRSMAGMEPAAGEGSGEGAVSQGGVPLALR